MRFTFFAIAMLTFVMSTVENSPQTGTARPNNEKFVDTTTGVLECHKQGEPCSFDEPMDWDSCCSDSHCPRRYELGRTCEKKTIAENGSTEQATTTLSSSPDKCLPMDSECEKAAEPCCEYFLCAKENKPSAPFKCTFVRYIREGHDGKFFIPLRPSEMLEGAATQTAFPTTTEIYSFCIDAGGRCGVNGEKDKYKCCKGLYCAIPKGQETREIHECVPSYRVPENGKIQYDFVGDKPKYPLPKQCVKGENDCSVLGDYSAEVECCPGAQCWDYGRRKSCSYLSG